MKRKWIIPLVVAVVLAMHAALVLRQFPLAVFRAGDVPMNGDAPRYFASTLGAAEAGGLYGYDPNFMAGYPVGLWNSMGKKGFEVAHWVLPGVPLPQLIYLMLVGVSFFAPLILWWTIRRLGVTPRYPWIAFGMVLLFWHLSSRIAYFWGFGNIFFPGTACLLVAACAALDRCLAGTRPLRWALGLGLLMSAVFYFHTVLLLAAVVPLCALAWYGRGRRLGWVAVALFVFLGLCLPWLWPLLEYRSDALAQPKAWFQGGTKYLIMDWFSDRAYRQHFDRNFLDRAAIIAGIVGMVLIWREGAKRRPRLVALGLGGCGCLALAYVGPYVHAAGGIQPYRFLIPAAILLIAPAAEAIDRAIDVTRQAGRKVQVLIAALCLILIPEVTAYCIDLVWGPEGTALTETDYKLYSRLREMAPEGRVFCDDPTLAHLMPYHAGVQTLGGLCSQAFLKHRFAGVDEDGVAFGKPVRELTPDMLRRYFDLYAVELAVITRGDYRRLADRSADFMERVGQEGSAILYRVKLPLRWTSDASAQVRRVRDRIQVDHASSQSLLLKFHYADWMTADNGVTLRPEFVADDPVPFINAVMPEGVTSFSVDIQPQSPAWR